MCGRYVSARGRQLIIDDFDVDHDAAGDLAPDYNVAPTKPVPVVLTRDVRELRVARWGLVPPWAKDISIGARLINARLETAHEKPAYRAAFARRRCLIPADGYYEWCATEGGPKQPYYITSADGAPLAMAGLYELRRADPAGSGDSAERPQPLGADCAATPWLLTCTVITTEATAEVEHIHHRMPMLLEPDRFGAWLDPACVEVERVRSLLGATPAGRLRAHPVSTAVNKVQNNGPELVKPLPPVGISEGDPALF